MVYLYTRAELFQAFISVQLILFCVGERALASIERGSDDLQKG